MNKYYTGIGSRMVSLDVILKIRKLAAILAKKGYIVRTGEAAGCDTAFSLGAIEACGTEAAIIYQAGIEVTKEAWKLVCSVHDKPKAARRYKSYLGRNPYQLLGTNLDNPSKFLICWTKDGKEIGGTRINMRLAKKFKIPVFNLALDSVPDILIMIENIEEES